MQSLCIFLRWQNCVLCCICEKVSVLVLSHCHRPEKANQSPRIFQFCLFNSQETSQFWSHFEKQQFSHKKKQLDIFIFSLLLVLTSSIMRLKPIFLKTNWNPDVSNCKTENINKFSRPLESISQRFCPSENWKPKTEKVNWRRKNSVGPLRLTFKGTLLKIATKNLKHKKLKKLKKKIQPPSRVDFTVTLLASSCSLLSPLLFWWKTFFFENLPKLV